MKKNYESGIGVRQIPKKFMRVMKLTAFLIIALTLHVSATGYSQNTRLSLNIQNSSVKDVLRQIEEQTDYRFIYTNEAINLDKKVDLRVDNKTVKDILDELFRGEGIRYTITDKNLILINPLDKSEAESLRRQNLMQQNLTIKGKVTDNQGQPLPGVTVVVKGTTVGTITDADGNYSLTQVSGNAILVFSFVGMRTQEIDVSGRPVINVQMEEETIGLEEVVAIGYGTMKKSDLTGSISSVSSEDLEKATPVNIQSALQGRAAGLVVTSNTGAPGSEASIRIRGIGTVNNNNPIYVVDGMIIDNSDPDNEASSISFLNPSDIESVEVLKDASAQAIYGSRGANGVILITTRKGVEGAPKVTFSSTWNVSKVARTADMMNASQYLNYVLEANYNGYMRSTPGADPDIDKQTINSATRTAVSQYNKGIDTDWMDEILKDNVFGQNYNLGISGGAKSSHYSLSAGYLDENGLIKKSSYTRYSYRINTDYNLGKYIKVGENLGITSSKKKGVTEDVNGVISRAMNIDPLTPVLKPEGEVDVFDPNYEYNKYAASAMGATFNPVAAIERTNLETKSLSLVGNIFAEVSILKDFKFRSSWGFNTANTDISDFDPSYYISNNDQSVVSTVSATKYKVRGWVWENTLTYNKTFAEDHTISALIGYTSERTRLDNMYAEKKGTANNDKEMQTFDSATDQPMVTGTYNIFTMASYLGRINYSFKNKYLLTASVRRDGSSKFASGNRWGTFPSFSVGWRADSEPFFKNIFENVIHSFKLRGGWGQIGNSSLPVYNAYVSQVETASNYRYVFDETANTGYYLKTIGTPDITWETTEQTNFGIDLGFLDNALTLSADYYIKKTKDMLLQVPVVSYAGYPSDASPYTNAGSVENKGAEIVINYRNKTGDFSYKLSANGSFFDNEVTSLGQGDKPIISDQNRTEVGSSIGRFYGWVTDGIFQTEAEVQNHVSPRGAVLQPNAHAGDFRFKNLNGDDVINADDETWIGDPMPKFTYGFNIDLAYKAFDLVAFFQGSCGNDIYNATLERMGSLAGEYNGYVDAYRDAWRGEGTSNTHPLMTTVDSNDNYRISDYYVENGSYLRLKNLQIGYNFPTAFCRRFDISNARVWVGGTDLFTITDYSGNDPEVGLSSTPTEDAGTDNFAPYPKMRKISLGINISF